MSTLSNKPNSYYNNIAKKLMPGDRVEVYGLIGCKDLIGVKTVKFIGPMNSSKNSLRMVWFEEGGGAWHPGAVKKVSLKN